MNKKEATTSNSPIIIEEMENITTDSIHISVALSKDSNITYAIMGDTLVVEHCAYANSRDMYRLFDFIAADIERFNIERFYGKSSFPLSFAKTLDACFSIDGIVE